MLEKKRIIWFMGMCFVFLILSCTEKNTLIDAELDGKLLVSVQGKESRKYYWYSIVNKQLVKEEFFFDGLNYEDNIRILDAKLFDGILHLYGVVYGEKEDLIVIFNGEGKLLNQFYIETAVLQGSAGTRFFKNRLFIEKKDLILIYDLINETITTVDECSEFGFNFRDVMSDGVTLVYEYRDKNKRNQITAFNIETNEERVIDYGNQVIYSQSCETLVYAYSSGDYEKIKIYDIESNSYTLTDINTFIEPYTYNINFLLIDDNTLIYSVEEKDLDFREKIGKFLFDNSFRYNKKVFLYDFKSNTTVEIPDFGDYPHFHFYLE